MLAWWLRERTTVSLHCIGQRLAMGHYTRVTQAVSRMKRQPGRKLEKLKQRHDKHEQKARMRNPECHFSRTDPFTAAFPAKDILHFDVLNVQPINGLDLRWRRHAFKPAKFNGCSMKKRC
jgi:hypothetical protein